MDLMTGLLCYVQVGALALGVFFTALAYGAGVFWILNGRSVKLTFTLWNLCSNSPSNEICHSISGEKYMEEVILTTRACGGISLLLMVALLAFGIYWLFSQRRTSVSDVWLHARSVLLLLLVLFLLILLTHSSNCPPKYHFGASQMPHSLGWGWALMMTSFVFVVPVCVIHCYEEVVLYRSNGNKT